MLINRIKRNKEVWCRCRLKWSQRKSGLGFDRVLYQFFLLFFSVVCWLMFSNKTRKRHTEEEAIRCTERSPGLIYEDYESAARLMALSFYWEGTVNKSTILVSYDLVDTEVESEGVLRLKDKTDLHYTSTRGDWQHVWHTWYCTDYWCSAKAVLYTAPREAAMSRTSKEVMPVTHETCLFIWGLWLDPSWDGSWALKSLSKFHLISLGDPNEALIVILWHQ